MSLKIRRGTNAERLTITPEVGEFLFTTDTKKVFIGDGITVGGIDVSSSTSSYLHNQAIAASIWTVTHNLGYKPGGIFVEDSSGEYWMGDIFHVNNNEFTITFSASFGGKVYVS